MTWLLAVPVIAALGIAAVLATGRGGQLGRAFDDRRESRVSAQAPLRAADLESVRFTTAFRGYRMDEVDALLDRLVAELARQEGRDAAGPQLQPPPTAATPGATEADEE